MFNVAPLVFQANTCLVHVWYGGVVGEIAVATWDEANLEISLFFWCSSLLNVECCWKESGLRSTKRLERRFCDECSQKSEYYNEAFLDGIQNMGGNDHERISGLGRLDAIMSTTSLPRIRSFASAPLAFCVSFVYYV